MKRLLQVPYFGALALAFPQNGEHIAALGEVTGEAALKRCLTRLSRTAAGQRIEAFPFPLL